jgi:hypothetical protein
MKTAAIWAGGAVFGLYALAYAAYASASWHRGADIALAFAIMSACAIGLLFKIIGMGDK